LRGLYDDLARDGILVGQYEPRAAASAAPSDAALDPADLGQLRAQAHRMLDDMLDYVADVRQRPVWQPMEPAVRAAFRSELPEQPTTLAEVHEDFLRYVLPYTVGNVHPGFMGWVHGGGTVVGMLAEMLAGGLNANCGGRDHAPIELEQQIVDWSRRLFRFPKTASGLFVTGTSMANLIALLVARRAALGPEVRHRGVGAAGSALVAYASSATHACVARAMDYAGLGSRALRLIPVDSEGRIDLDALRKTQALDRSAGLRPFMLIGNAGTVHIGAIDDLASLADIAAEEDLWFHVDGAFGALGILSPEIAPRLAGIERADSLAFDFHKWAQVPYDAGFILVRNGRLHHDTFATCADYLRREGGALAGGEFWPNDFGPDLSRSFRALKTWFTLRVYGTGRLGAAIWRSCCVARHLQERIAAEGRLELLAPVPLNIVCFRYRGCDPDSLNAAIVADLQQSGIAAPSTTRIGGQLAIRAAIFNHRTRECDVDALVDAVVRFGDHRSQARR
jgi:aromatic-L-amino-acid/L-tryptophan decarboxylase